MTGSLQHVDVIANIEADDFMPEWFKAWTTALGKRHADGGPPDILPLRETVLEAISDASAEQFLTPLTARHLRRFGTSYFARHDLRFWARSEWAKVDLCYGLAPKNGFANDWEKAWTCGDTGDLGQIEVKVFYAHEAESERREKWNVLVRQLRARATYRAHTTNRRKQRYFALAWLFEHGGCLRLASLRDHLTSAAANDAILATASGLAPEAHDLGTLWPSTGGSTYACGLDLLLFELCESGDEDGLGAG